jgi:hypothetical protein
MSNPIWGPRTDILLIVSVSLRPMVSRSVGHGVKPHLEPKTRFLLLSDSCSFVDVGRPAENSASHNSFIVACITVATLTWYLLCRNLVTDEFPDTAIPGFKSHVTTLRNVRNQLLCTDKVNVAVKLQTCVQGGGFETRLRHLLS